MASSCVLRATGDNFNPDNFLKDSSFDACNVFYKGERRHATSNWSSSGITVELSSADNFTVQIQEAVVFLETNHSELLRLKEFAGIESISLDFGVMAKENWVQSYIFPFVIIKLASELKLELEISIYEV